MARAVSPPRRNLDAMPAPRTDGDSYTAPLAPRLVDSPGFVLSSVRSGSTLRRPLSGRIQQARQADPTAQLPPRLAELAKAWGYPVG